jgi:hypothetical protein
MARAPRPKTANLWAASRLLAGVMALGCVAAIAGEAAADGHAAFALADRTSEAEETIIINGALVRGFPVLPANETEFRLKLTLTKTIVGFRWQDLQEDERRRVQKVFGRSEGTADGRPLFAEKVTGVRLLLRSGKSVEGLPIPERSGQGKIALRTATMPFIEVIENDVQSKETIECDASVFFTALEMYERWLLAKPLRDNDAPGYLAMAQRVANIGLFGKALEIMRMAVTIDPQMAERNKELVAHLATEDAQQQAETQLAVLRAMAGEKLFSATAGGETCPDCQGAGFISVTGGSGNLEPHRCPYCRGIGKVFKVTYK